MSKTIKQALLDEILYPIGEGIVENKIIMRGLSGSDEFTSDIAVLPEFRGALADCLYTLIQSVNFSEADKSVGALTDKQREAILSLVNRLYASIGEEEVEISAPVVYIVNK